MFSFLENFSHKSCQLFHPSTAEIQSAQEVWIYLQRFFYKAVNLGHLLLAQKQVFALFDTVIPGSSISFWIVLEDYPPSLMSAPSEYLEGVNPPPFISQPISSYSDD